jgi:chromosomal replication initiator protein
VRYATIEEFTTGFVDAVRRHTTGDFKNDFRGADVVLIDDVQFLAGRTKTREEFFHTFNSLLDSGRQLVISSDRSPDELPGLEDRLAERFRSGLVVELEPPPAPLRRAILAKRARLDGVDVPNEVLAEIAHRVDSSVRALEGALIRVVAYHSLTERPLTAELATEVLDRLYPRPRDAGHSVRDVQLVCCEAFDVSLEELLSRSRATRVTWPRQVAMYLARELTDTTLPSLGRQFGGRDHTTVLHAHQRIAQRVAQDEAARSAVAALRERLSQGTT